ncbi:MAG: hypothetical protein CVT70_15855 [Alphaproteobacteria bacterium HGW-Alphaproteobacteria-1]|jgi:hypothetical protein|nr:MAG: hypothetical protein CVT70_15855 [Alphaproteobacteria bacterium HGW-Alphaproteobacteria-1]
MQVVIHAGAHRTDEDRLVTCLRDNFEVLRARGTLVPAPESYRRPIRELFQTAQANALPEDARASVLSVTGADEVTARLVLSNHGFFGTPKMTVGSGRFYAAAEMRLAQMRRMFAGDGIELFLALRNPATFLPALLPDTPFATVADLLRGDDPMTLRWSETVARLRAAFPDMALTVWCNEDTPIIWGEVLRKMAGVEAEMPLVGEFALLSEIMTAPGLKRFHDYVASRPGLTEEQKRRVVAAFLDKFADETAIEQELDVPGWDAPLVDRLSALYDADIETIAAMDGVTFIAP